MNVWEGVNATRRGSVQKLATHILQRGTHTLAVVPGQDHVDDVVTMIRSHGGRLVSVTPQKRSLEDLFLGEAKKPQVFDQAVGA